jgi:hypothetical protein
MVLPLLLGLLGSGAAGAGMLGTLSPLIAGALGSGLGSAIETGDIGEGIKTGLLSGVLGGIGGSLTGGAAGAAGAAPLPAMASNMGTALPGVAAPSGIMGMLKNMPSGMSAVGKTAGLGLPGMMQQGLKQGIMSGAGMGTALGGMAMTKPPSFDTEEEPYIPRANPLTRERYTPAADYRGGTSPEFQYFGPARYAEGGMVGAPRSMFNPGPDFDYSSMIPVDGLPQREMREIEERRRLRERTEDGRPNPFFNGLFGKSSDTSELLGTRAAPMQRVMNQLPEGYQAGVSPEFKFFGPAQAQAQAQAQAAPNQQPVAFDRDDPANDNIRNNPMLAIMRGILNPGAPYSGPDKFAVFGDLGRNFMAHSAGLPTEPASVFSPAKMADGGTVMTPSGLEPIAMQGGGIVDIAGAMAPGGQMNEKNIVEGAIAAVEGRIPEEQAAPILAAFVQAYGEEALRSLVDDVRMGRSPQGGEGPVRGPGDGMADMVPAEMRDGSSDVLLSDGEFVIPADVVSGLGNGSTDAGAAELDRMMSRVRQERTGSTTQPAAMNVGGVVPA